jgi:hypothetical protein
VLDVEEAMRAQVSNPGGQSCSRASSLDARWAALVVLNVGDKELKQLDENLVKTGDEQGSQHGHPCTRDDYVDAGGDGEPTKKMCG